MELASIGTTSHLDALGDCVAAQLARDGVRASVQSDVEGVLGVMRVRLRGRQCSAQRRTRCLQAVAKGVAQCVVDVFEPELLAHLLQRRYGAFDAGERAGILTGARLHLERGPYASAVFREARVTGVAAPLATELFETGALVVDGMLTFRLPRYIASLEEALGHAVDDHLLEREYSEFIRLLRYFVAAQPPRTDRVDLVLEGAQFRLFDRDGKPMAVESMPNLELESVEAAINYEDVLISALISAAPTRIVVHGTRARPSQHVDSVRRVFEARVVPCERSRCGLCASA